MASNFASILDRPSNTIERPKPLPAGTYLCTVKGLPRFDKSSKKQTPFVEFTLVPTAPMDDVNAEELASMGGIADKFIRATYYETEASAWRLTEFLDHCGLDTESGKYTPRQLIDHTPNAQVYATLKHEAGNDGKSVYATLAATARVD